MKDPKKEFQEILKQTKIIKKPKRRLATFGQTRINYFFISEVKGFKDRSRLREGIVIAEKPDIITPETLRDRFQGFGKEARQFTRWLIEEYGDSFQGLTYSFKNKFKSSHIEHSSVKDLADRITSRLEKEEIYHSVVMNGPDLAWHVALMKFIVDECMASFVSNVRELDEHGFFDTPEKLEKDRVGEIESLFDRAAKNRKLIPLLGSKLQQYDLFKHYEDRFFRLIKS